MRDILLGEPGFDVDLAVEGDGPAFAQALAKELGGRVAAPRRVRHGRRRVRRRRARRRGHRAPRALRRAGGAADRRAVDDPGRPLPPRLHHQRDGGRARRARPRPARRPVRGQARPGREDDPRAPRRLVRRRPDADLPGASLREPLRLRAGRAHRRPGPRGDRVAASWGGSRRLGCATSSCCCSTSRGPTASFARLARARRRSRDPPGPRGRRGRRERCSSACGAARPLRPRDPVLAPRPRGACARHPTSRGRGSTA